MISDRLTAQTSVQSGMCSTTVPQRAHSLPTRRQIHANQALIPIFDSRMTF